MTQFEGSIDEATARAMKRQWLERLIENGATDYINGTNWGINFMNTQVLAERKSRTPYFKADK